MKKWGMLAASTALLATAAMAGGHTENTTKGFYVEGAAGYGNAGYTKAYVENVNKNSDTSDEHKKSIAWLGDFGYAINPYFAVEAGFMVLPRLSYKQKLVENDEEVGKTQYKRIQMGYTLAARGTYPIDDQFSVFGKAGVIFDWKNVYSVNQYEEGYVPTDKDNYPASVTYHMHGTRVLPFFALGADYAITPQWAANVQAIVTAKAGHALESPYEPDAGFNGSYRPGAFFVVVGATYRFT